MSFRATLSDGKTTAREPVVVERVAGDRLRIAGERERLEVPLDDCDFGAPIGRIRRVIRLPGGRILESDDIEAVDAIGDSLSTGRGLRWVHRLESRWRMVFASVVVVIGFVWAFYQFGIPAIARDIAGRLPMPVLRVATDQAVLILDKLVLDESKLPEERRKEVTEGLDVVVEALGTEPFEYRLHFRSAKEIPNAFALPAGDIFITDTLIEEAKNDREIFAVLAHEVTHVENRHGMRMVLQNTGVLFLVSVLLGDVVSASSMGAALPTVLAESGYSRGFEEEADAGAAHYCIECGWGTGPLRDFLTRIAPPGQVPEMSWMSSHPDTSKRVEALLKIEKDRAKEPEGE